MGKEEISMHQQKKIIILWFYIALPFGAVKTKKKTFE